MSTAAPTLAADLTAGLKRLKMAGMRRLAPELLVTAKTQRWNPEEFLRTLVEAEIAARDESNARTRRRQACFPVSKTLDEYDLTAPPDHRDRVESLITNTSRALPSATGGSQPSPPLKSRLRGYRPSQSLVSDHRAAPGADPALSVQCPRPRSRRLPAPYGSDRVAAHPIAGSEIGVRVPASCVWWRTRGSPSPMYKKCDRRTRPS